jgi:hypothetical protein
MTDARTSPDARPSDQPDVVPQLELRGSQAEKLRAIDAAIIRMEILRESLAGEPARPRPPEVQGPYINAPVWPWFAAGWSLGVLCVLMFIVAWWWS